MRPRENNRTRKRDSGAERRPEQKDENMLEKWVPKTVLGKKVKDGEIKNIDEIIDSGQRIFEAEIVDALVPNLSSELLSVGQSKGKFGGGKESIWKQTQKKTCEKSKVKFTAFAIVGNKDGYIGVGHGGSKETVPAREKAIRNAKLNIIKIKRACGSWDCDCRQPHSIPFKISGRTGSVVFTMSPAPRGTRIKAEKKCAKMLELAGIQDVYSKVRGQSATKLNLFMACFDALKKLSIVKVNSGFEKESGMVEGSLKEKKE